MLLVVLGRAARRDRIEGHAYDIPSANDRIVVEVLNGTTRPGLARKGTRQLRGRGLDVVYFGGADTAVDSTRILLRRGAADAAERVRSALGAGTVRTALDTLRRVDVTVILGWDYHPAEEGHP